MCPSSTCAGGKCCAAAAVRLTPVVLPSKGLCARSGMELIPNKAQCEAAAKAVGMSGTSAKTPNFSSGNPPGCFAYNPRSLYFNPNLGGSYTSSSFEPLCYLRHTCTH